jgi:hypothetical protein
MLRNDQVIYFSVLFSIIIYKPNLVFADATWKSDWKQFRGGVLRVTSINVSYLLYGGISFLISNKDISFLTFFLSIHL